MEAVTARADTVGSLLRPQELLEARERYAAGGLSTTEFERVEDQARRSVEQAHLMAHQSTESVLTVDTSDRSVANVAHEILKRTGWPDGSG